MKWFSRFFKGPLTLSVPWNLPCYIPSNGFHPLYEPLFEGNSDQLNLFHIDEFALAAALQRIDSPLPRILAGKQDIEGKLSRLTYGTETGSRLVQHVSTLDLATMDLVPASIEFHHTAPLGLGRKPFILHCEELVPTFIPFSVGGDGTLSDAHKVRDFYVRLFEHEHCLGILSHRDETLAQFSLFFKSGIVDRKLHKTRIGISERKLKRLTESDKSSLSAPVFLFTNSAHQHPASFHKRGGVASLHFAKLMLDAWPASKFIFRTTRLLDQELVDLGVDVPWLKTVEGTNIQWQEQFLSDDEQLDLFALADFFLLPSYNLHSVTLMQAIAAGTIPLVTDTRGPELYVTNDVTGLVIEGIRELLWHQDPETGIDVVRDRLPAGTEKRMSEQMFAKVDRLLRNPSQIHAMRAQMRKVAVERFSGSAFRDDFVNVVDRIAPRRLRTALQPSPLITDRFPRAFASPPSPFIVREHQGWTTRFCKGVYYEITPGVAMTVQDYFPTNLSLNGWLKSRKVRLLADPFADSHENLRILRNLH